MQLAPAGASLVSRFTFSWLSGYFPELCSKISVSDNPLCGKIIFEHVLGNWGLAGGFITDMEASAQHMGRPPHHGDKEDGPSPWAGWGLLGVRLQEGLLGKEKSGEMV